MTLFSRAASWRPGRRLLVIVVFAGVLLLLAWTGLDLWAGRRAAAAFARLEARYGRLDARSIASPSVPGNDNRARAVRAAALLNVPSGSADPNYSTVVRAVLRLRQLPDSAVVPDEIHGFVERNGEAIRIAEMALDRPRASWDADYIWSGSVPAWLPVRTLSNLLYAAARVEMRAGRTDAAVRRITAGLAMSASIRQEPNLIAQLVRIAIADEHCEAIRRLVGGSELSMDELQQLAHWLEENRQPEPVRAGLLAELRFGNNAFGNMERGLFRPLESFPFGEPSLWLELGRIGRPFVRLAHARYLANIDRLIDSQAGARPRQRALDPGLPAWWNWRRLSDSPLPGLERAIDTGDAFANVLAVTEIGVALRRYRLDRGTYPDDLSALVPAYIPRVPPDRATGAPLVYARRGGGFILKAASAPTTRPNFLVPEWDIAK